MDEKLRRRWVRKLRERGRVQGHGLLCQVDESGVRRQCCLDVLVEAVLEDRPGLVAREVNRFGVVQYKAESSYIRESGILPGPVAAVAGLATNPTVRAPSGWRRWLYPRRYRGRVIAMTRLNDGHGEPFRVIARMIRWGVVR